MNPVQRLESLLRIYHAEARTIGRRPKITPREISAYCGITDRKTLTFLTTRARDYLERCIRAEIVAKGGRGTVHSVKPTRFVAKSEEGYRIILA